MPEGASGTKAHRRDTPATRPCRSCRGDQVRARRHSRRPRARERAARQHPASPPARLRGKLLGRFGVRIASHVSAIGDVMLPPGRTVSFDEAQAIDDAAPLALRGSRAADPDDGVHRCRARAGDTVGGVFEVIVSGVPAGLWLLRAVGPQARRPSGAGDHVHPRDQSGWHRHRARRRLPPRIACARRDSAAARRRPRAGPADQSGRRPRRGVTNGEDVRVSAS